MTVFKTDEEAFNDWVDSPMFMSGLSRYEWAIKGATKETFRQDLWWAFNAGWNSRYQNLSVKDI